MWYKALQIRKAQRGEWWITDSGPQFADGDIGDANHRMLAEDHILRQLGWDLSEDIVTPDTANQYMNEIHESEARAYSPYWDRFVQYGTKRYKDSGDNPWWYNTTYKDYIQWLHQHGLPKAHRMPEHEVSRHLEGLSKDPIQYVIANNRWIRVHGNHIELYDLDDATLQNLADGLYEANDEDVEDMTFDIEVNKYNVLLQHVPYSDIESGKVKEQLQERTQKSHEPPPLFIPKQQLELPFADETLERLYRHVGGEQTVFNLKAYAAKKKDLFNYFQLGKEEWREQLEEAHEKFGVYFNNENDEPIAQRKIVIPDPRAGDDDYLQQHPYKFVCELRSAGGDWETPVRYFRAQITDGFLNGKSQYNHAYFCFIPNKEQGNPHLQSIEKGRNKGKLTAPDGNDYNKVPKPNDRKCWESMKEYLEQMVENERPEEYANLEK